MTVLRALIDANFAAAVAGPGVVLVHFTAAWCQPCTKAAPIVAELAGELRRHAVVVTADIDAAPQAANRADVRGVPCLVLFRDGERMANLMGQYPRERLRAWVDGVLKGAK